MGLVSRSSPVDGGHYQKFKTTLIAFCYFDLLGQEMAELEFGQQTRPSTNTGQRDETTNNNVFKIYHHTNVSLKHIVTLKLIHEVK